MQEFPHNLRKATRIVLMDYVPSIKRNETSIGPSRRHLLAVLLRRNPALLTPDQERRASSREPVGPVVAIELKLRFKHLTRFERKPPAVWGRAKGIQEVWRQPLPDAFFERFTASSLSDFYGPAY